MRTLVVFYSLDGNTKEAAAKIAEGLSADLLELKPERDIPKEGFGKFLNGGRMATFGLGTKLLPYEVDPSSYDRIILGTPIWAGKPTPAVNQFIKDLADKSKVYAAFTCSGGGDNEKCIIALNKKLPEMKISVSLTDRVNKDLSPANEEKLDKFIEALK